jgi:D-alanyl-lipoteichoic acid acyltransferase DltB (MBOAT superfamily)
LALGIGLLLGYNVGVNFDSPYMATNLRDFWRRWHISLSSWLRDYLYIPLGGGRRGFKPLNLFLTQGLGGLWHGAHLRYLLWGVLHGFGLIISHYRLDRRQRANQALGGVKLRAWQKRPPRFRLWRSLGGFLVTFNFVSFCWILFRAEDSTRAWEIVKAAADFSRPGSGAPLQVWLIIGLTLFMQAAGVHVREAFLKIQSRFSGPALALWCAFWVVIILKLGPAGVLPFIYFQY